MSVATAPLLELSQVEVRFRLRGARGVRRSELRAVDGVDLTVGPGEVVALVGESGSGKTTLGRCVLGLQRPTAGRVALDGRDVDPRTAPGLVQPIFQDPYSSLDPRWAVGRSIREPLDAQGVGTPAERAARVEELLEQVGLQPGLARRLPRELSGGQRQRVAIAAALAPRPRLIVADEAVSALDMLVQAQILNLIAVLREELGVSILFITHDLAVVRHIADRVAVMYLGRIVEEGAVDAVFAAPRHPYTRALLEAHPEPDPSRRAAPPQVGGEIANPLEPPSGCPFHPRCPVAEEVCTSVRPPATVFSPLQRAACHVAARALSPPTNHHEEAACPPHP